jgi:multiple antibiotic resistance protein
MDQSKDFVTRSILISAIFAVCLVTMVILISGSRILRFLGETGNKVMMKLMGLIVMVIAVEFFFTGIRYYVQLIAESI